MIAHFVGVLARAILGAVGIRIGERKLGVCGAWYCGVWSSDDRLTVHGEWFHADCAKYVSRGVA